MNMWTAQDVLRAAKCMEPSVRLLRAEAAAVADQANREHRGLSWANVEDLIWDAV